MSQRIEHRGVVESIDQNVVYVRVERKSACSECHAKGLCGESGSERLMQVTTSDASMFKVGDKVCVALQSTKIGLAATLWAYLIPLVILVGTLCVAKAAGSQDGIAAIIALGATAGYYVVLYVMRRYFDRKFNFTIIKES